MMIQKWKKTFVLGKNILTFFIMKQESEAWSVIITETQKWFFEYFADLL